MSLPSELDPLGDPEEEPQGTNIKQFLVLLLCYIAFLVMGAFVFMALQFEEQETLITIDHPTWQLFKGNLSSIVPNRNACTSLALNLEQVNNKQNLGSF